MTKEARISKSETARGDLVAFHLIFGFRYSFDIRHSDFVIFQARFRAHWLGELRRERSHEQGQSHCNCGKPCLASWRCLRASSRSAAARGTQASPQKKLQLVSARSSRHWACSR